MWSLPSRGAWIETSIEQVKLYADPSLPSRGAWIETNMLYNIKHVKEGRSLRGERGLKHMGE